MIPKCRKVTAESVHNFPFLPYSKERRRKGEPAE
jgi:hypothetical protein